MRKNDFMKMINDSFATGGLTCSFQDQQLSEFAKIKRRIANQIPTKKAVKVIGPQNTDLWVLGPDIYISNTGNQISSEESDYIWISHLYNGPGVAPNTSTCLISLPLSSEPSIDLLEKLKSIMKHNFFPAVFTLAAFIKALHYDTIKKNLKTARCH